MRVKLSCLFVLLALFLSPALLSDPVLAQCPFPPPAAPPPAAPVCAVDALVFGTPVAFMWGVPPPACGPVLHDALVGDLGVAWATKSVGASALGCIVAEDDAVPPPAAADATIPPVGSGFWYLARAATPGPDFSWNEPAGTNAYDRDLLLVGFCP